VRKEVQTPNPSLSDLEATENLTKFEEDAEPAAATVPLYLGDAARDPIEN